MSGPIVPLSQFVLKVHSRCDLACDHCYVYEGPDQSWSARPSMMSDEVVANAGARIAEYATAHQLAGVQVILHGGEPLLVGPAGLRQIMTALRLALRDVPNVDLRIHTNGVQLNQEFCQLFAEFNVKVGISLDGDRAANDRHRRYRNGRSSYDKVIKATKLLSSGFHDLYAGLLCTIDVANDPLVVYRALVDLDPPLIDFLLPHATWVNQPTRRGGGDGDYADWLIAVFEQWISDERPVPIRTFESILSTLRGGESQTEALGLAPSSLVVIETDGSYEQADSLKTAFDGAPATGFDVSQHSLDVVGQHPGITARQQGLAGLCQTCRECPVVTSCGGGLFAHRYRPDTGFSNPSVYCSDLLKLITHIQDRLPQLVQARTHVVEGADFWALASGLGDATAITQLIEAQHSKLRRLLGDVYGAAATSAAPDAVPADIQSAWALLTKIDREHPRAVDKVLSHPYLRVWASQCRRELLQRQRGGADTQPGSAMRSTADLRYLSAIAAAAAVRAGASARLTVATQDQAIYLPTLGSLAVADASGDATVEMTHDTVTIQVGGERYNLSRDELIAGRSSLSPAASHGKPAEWLPVRTLRAPGISVALEDCDPYRKCHQRPVAPRLSDTEFTRWQRHFQHAWQLIQEEQKSYAPALAAGLHTLMPLSPGPRGRAISEAARDAFGAIAIALPDDSVILALLLIHEFQHVKLGAVLDFYDLYDPADKETYHAPWRDDARPLEGLLQGSYAHLAVTDFWRGRQEATSGLTAEAAGRQFAHRRTQTRLAIDTLLNSGSLTPLGMRFVAEMRHSVSSVPAMTSSPRASRSAPLATS